MPEGRVAAPPAQRGGPAPVAADGGWQKTAQGILKSVAMFVGIQMVMKYGMSYMGINTAKTPAVTTPTPQSTVPGAAPVPGTLMAEPLWPLGTPLSMLLYASTQSDGRDLNFHEPLVVWDGLTYGDYADVRDTTLSVDIPDSVRLYNGSLWLDVVLLKDGGKNPLEKSREDVAISRKQLTRFLPVKKVRKEKKLMAGKDEKEEEPEPVVAAQIAAHWSSNLTLTIVSSGGSINFAQIPPTASPYYSLAPTPSGKQGNYYYPPVFSNDFWLLRENMHQITPLNSTLPLQINYQALSSMKFNIFSAMTQSMDAAANTQGGGAEMDEMKRMLTETNPWLLGTTILVTILHMVFELLAFSSDVSHWRKKDKDLVGVSLNTILTNCFVQLVILLYLQDTSEETSFMILFGQGIGLLIEAWKITKVVDVRVRETPDSFIGYKITFEDKKVLSEDERKTQEYDQLAFRLVSYFAIPALAGYTIYSLIYETHRGWYSFVITTLAQAIYMFGFVQLVPQLIINYKLKSVAHMPMKAMMYKTLSTVVDDFFAFCIRMPWLHRLACFRDDAVFVVLLYQRWIYRIDYSRINEYGQVNVGMVEPVGGAKVAEGDKKVIEGEVLESKKDR